MIGDRPWGPKRWAAVVLGVVGLLLLAIAGTLWRTNRGDLSRAARFVRARNERRAVREGENLAEYLHRLDSLGIEMPGRVDRSQREGRWEPAVFPEAAAWLEEIRPALDTLTEVRRYTGFCRSWDPTCPPYEWRADSRPVMDLCEGALLRVRRIDSRRVDTRMDDLEAVHTIGTLLMDEHSTGCYTGVALRCMALGCARQIALAQTRESDLRSFMDRTRRLCRTSTSCEGFLEDTIAAAAVNLEHFYAGRLEGFEDWEGRLFHRFLTWRPGVEAALEEAHAALRGMSRHPPYTSQYREAHTRWQTAVEWRGMRGLAGGRVANHMCGTRDMSVQCRWEDRAVHDLLLLLVAACGYRAEHGAFPERPESLVPGWLDALPVDPFSGRSYGYRVLPDGTVRLWTVGPDGIDKGPEGEERSHVVGELFPPCLPRPRTRQARR